MLKLNYIIVDALPQSELQYLQKNLNPEKKYDTDKTEHKELPAKSWQLVLLQEKERPLSEYPAEECIFISGREKQLQKAASLGMATLGYLPPDEQMLCGEEEKECRDEETTSLAIDMYAEGLEEVDFTFLNHVYQRHHNIPWVIMETERCMIREFSMDYLDELFEMYAGEGMTDYMEPLYDYEEEKKYQQAYIENMYRFYGYGMWIVCDKQTGRLIGRVGIEHREELGGELELGYAIGVPYQKKGYATEVCKAVLSYVREELKVPQICCLIEPENKASVRFAEKIGFILTETINISGRKMQKYVLMT